MVDLGIIKARDLSLFEKKNIFLTPIMDTGQRLSQVDSCVGIVSNTDQKYLPIKFIDSAYRTIQTVWYINGMRRCNLVCLWPFRGEGMGAVTA